MLIEKPFTLNSIPSMWKNIQSVSKLFVASISMASMVLQEFIRRDPRYQVIG